MIRAIGVIRGAFLACLLATDFTDFTDGRAEWTAHRTGEGEPVGRSHGDLKASIASLAHLCYKHCVKTTFDIAEAQVRLPQLIRFKQTVSLREHNETVAFLVPRDRMEALLETMEILANPAARRAIRRDQSGRGDYLPLSVLDEDESRTGSAGG